MKFGRQTKSFRNLNKYKPSNYTADSVFGPFVSRRHTKVFYEHTKDCSFSPRINKTTDNRGLDYLQKRHLSLIEEGMYDDMNDLLLKQLGEMKAIPVEDSPKKK